LLTFVSYGVRNTLCGGGPLPMEAFAVGGRSVH
jgi:hypothetical protein